MSKQRFICNSCGEVRATSREHLIHQSIGAVLFRDPTIRTRNLRQQLKDNLFLSRFLRHKEGNDPEGILFDDSIVNLMCGPCNNRWANDLERSAGPNLYAFVHENGAVEGRLLRRWVWFFAIKMWWYKEATTVLQSGALQPIMRRLANPASNMLLYTRVARLDASPNVWRFGWAHSTSKQDIRFEFWFWGITFFALGQQLGEPRLPFKTIELTDGVTAAYLPTVRLAALAQLPEVRVAL
jgi:hypothetical protein